ncbi:hypothetical protein [Paraburkholderia rhynchosiae]|uniref:Uncharacterized protein n=1 Tax=Paraburkholderia rhynchosiae TaxID=487049 RepID=A0ABX4V4C4_9BURK|nr:hypothetical protein [Paraburkholderia rhynchosiae]PMS28999.1 hypothetical protein C0Z16_21525 [Paraburkholderia rhynchosiae]
MIGPRVKPRVARLPVFDPTPASFGESCAALQAAEDEQDRPRIGLMRRRRSGFFPYGAAVLRSPISEDCANHSEKPD